MIKCPYARGGFAFPAPIVEVQIQDTIKNLSPIKFRALVDTGADMSAIPRGVVESGPNRFYHAVRRIQDLDGSTRDNDAVMFAKCDVRLYCPETGEATKNLEAEMFELLVLPEGLIGRDILSALVCEFDGTNPSLWIKA